MGNALQTPRSKGQPGQAG